MCINKKDMLLRQLRRIIKKQEMLLRKMAEIHEHDKYKVANQIVKDSKVCFVLLCPGQEELIAGAPCQGKTGQNLNELLEILNEKKGDIFLHKEKKEYTIINATTVVHIEAFDGDKPAIKEEIKNEAEEIREFIRENENIEYAILCGEDAQGLENVFNDKNITTIKTRHLGFKGINQIDKDKEGKEINEANYPKAEERTKARLNAIANDIIKQIEEKDNGKNKNSI